MGTREKLFRQKLANQIESLLAASEKVFTREKLDDEWLETMLKKTQELTSGLTIYQFLHELPENEALQLEFLEFKEAMKEVDEINAESYGKEILKEIDEFESQEAEDVFITEEEQEEEPEEAIEEIAVPTEEIEAIEEVEVIEEAPIEVEEEVQEEPKPAPVQEPEPQKEAKPKKESKTEAVTPLPKKESVPEEKKEINDSIALSETSLADKLRSKSIKKLAESIALNERFLYSNELFNGNMEAFKRALNELDHIASKEDAQRYIELQLQVENNWDLESETVQSFITLVERRFN